MFGHEAVGIVERVGNGVKKLRVGEKSYSKLDKLQKKSKKCFRLFTL